MHVYSVLWCSVVYYSTLLASFQHLCAPIFYNHHPRPPPPPSRAFFSNPHRRHSSPATMPNNLPIRALQVNNNPPPPLNPLTEQGGGFRSHPPSPPSICTNRTRKPTRRRTDRHRRQPPATTQAPTPAHPDRILWNNRTAGPIDTRDNRRAQRTQTYTKTHPLKLTTTHQRLAPLAIVVMNH